MVSRRAKRGGDIVIAPCLQGHLDGPPVVEPLELLPLPLGLGAGLLLGDAGRVGLAAGDVRPVALPFGVGLGGPRRVLRPFGGPPLPEGRASQPAEHRRQQRESISGGQRRLPTCRLGHAFEPRHRPAPADRLAGQEPPQVGRERRGGGNTAGPAPSPGISGRRSPGRGIDRIRLRQRDGLVADDLEHGCPIARGRLERRPAQ